MLQALLRLRRRKSARRCSAARRRLPGLIASRTAWLPHSGADLRKHERLAPAGRFAITASIIRGITSPARCTMTVSPMLMSLRAISSSLCSVAFETTTPPTVTGSSLRDRRQRARCGRPGCRSSRRIVIACSAGNLCATAQRGERDDEAEPVLPVEAVDLVDDAVDVVAERSRGARRSRGR